MPADLATARAAAQRVLDDRIAVAAHGRALDPMQRDAETLAMFVLDLPRTPPIPPNPAPLTEAELTALEKIARGWFGSAQLELHPDDPSIIRVSPDDESFPGTTFAEFNFDDAAGDTLRLCNAAPALVAEVRRLRAALATACDRLTVIVEGEGGSVRANVPEMPAWRALAHPGPAAGEVKP